MFKRLPYQSVLRIGCTASIMVPVYRVFPWAIISNSVLVAMYTSIRLTKISLALNRSRSKATMAAQLCHPTGEQNDRNNPGPRALVRQQRHATGGHLPMTNCPLRPTNRYWSESTRSAPRQSAGRIHGQPAQQADLSALKRLGKPFHRVFAQQNKEQHANAHGHRQGQQRCRISPQLGCCGVVPT